MTNAPSKYALGYKDDETARLAQQAQLLDTSTKEFLCKAGLAPGMRVLDCGSGAGHVTAIAARIVGPTGKVIGVDRNAAAFPTVLSRLQKDGLANVELVSAELPDVSGVPGYGSFDAVIGRLVLLYLPDPSKTLSALTRAVSPGGIVAFQEIAMTTAFARPPCPSLDTARDILVDAFKAAGADPDCGLALNTAFRQCGLTPHFTATAFVEGAQDASVVAWVAATLRSLAPVIEHHKLGRGLDLSDIDGQMRRQIEENASVVVGPLIVGAFARFS